MRRSGRQTSSAASLSVPIAATSSKTRTGTKMIWKNAVVKIRSGKKMAELGSVSNARKPRAATKVAAMDTLAYKTVKRIDFAKKSDTETSKSEVPKTPRFSSEPVVPKEDGNVEQNYPVQNMPASTVSTPTSSSPRSCGKEQLLGTKDSLIGNLTKIPENSSQLPYEGDAQKKLKPGDHIGNIHEGEELPICSTNANSHRELSEDEKCQILADFDAGMLPHEIEEKYGIGKLKIADVLSNRISVFRQQIPSCPEVYALKRRRTVYVRLNMHMWQFFCHCRDRKIWLNGRQLKEQALKIAHELGLHNFKASEGWLDSFKRRHSIDLRTMTGNPVIYETDSDEGYLANDECMQFSPHSSFSTPQTLKDSNSSPVLLDTNKFLMDATDAAVLSCTTNDSEGTNPTQATATVEATNPLDIQRFLPSSSVAHGQTVMPSTINVSEFGASTIQALVETCCCRVNEVEVSQAIDTLRAYIVSNDINLLPMLVTLQRGLSAISVQRNTEKMLHNIQQTGRTSQEDNVCSATNLQT